MVLRTLVAERDSLPLHSAILPKNNTDLDFRDLTLIPAGNTVKVFYELTGSIAGKPVISTCVQDFDQNCEVEEVAETIARRIMKEYKASNQAYIEEFAGLYGLDI